MALGVEVREHCATMTYLGVAAGVAHANVATMTTDGGTEMDGSRFSATLAQLGIIPFAWRMAKSLVGKR